MTTHPAAAALGAYSRETSPPGENSAISTWLKSNSARLPTEWRLSRNVTDLPSERSLASANSCLSGNLRSSSTSTMVSPTRPVAPTTATLKPSPPALPLMFAPVSLSDDRRCRLYIHVLAAMSQVMVHQHDGEHCLGDRHGTQPHARIMATGGGDFDRVTGEIDGAARDLDARSRLHCQVCDDVLARGNAAQHPARVIA